MKIFSSKVPRCVRRTFSNKTPAVAIVLLFWLFVWPSSGVRGQDASGQVPASQNRAPHFENVRGRNILFVDGLPFTVLAVEIPWDRLIYGRYRETMTAYDDLYPAAAAVGLNALKVPIKWSMVEPRPGAYDFAYVDHARDLARKNHLRLILDWFGHYASGDGTIYANLTGEMYAPFDIIRDEKTYPRAIDGNGVVHHNAASYEDDAIIQREIAAFSAFMEHIKKVDADTHTILMIQVENEIAVFGADRQNRKLWRDHSPAADRLSAEKGFSDDLKYSAWRLSSNWIRRVTEAGAQIDPLPFFHNYVGGKLEDEIVGGSPGEDVATYLANCPRIAFIGINLYLPGDSSVNDFRSVLTRYRVGRNMPSITETNSDRSPVAPRLAYVAIGEFGAPIFAPWALNISYPTPYQPYVLKDGSLANGAFALRECYTSLSMALPQISTYGGTKKLKVFMSQLPGEHFSQTQDVDGAKVTVSGEQNGQAIVIHLERNEFLVIGYRCEVSLEDPSFVWPALQQVRVERGRFAGDQWKQEGEPEYWINQSRSTLGISLDTPQVVRASW
jgi:Domain of unknown function (DUF5597)